MGRAIETLGWSWEFCSSHAFNTSLQSSLLYYYVILRSIPTLRPRSTESSVVYDNMWYLPPGYRGQSHFIIHRFTVIQYVRSTRAYNIASILLVLERTISCNLIVRSLTSGHTHNSIINRSTKATDSEKGVFFCTLFCSPDSKYRTVLNSVVPAL